MDFSYPVFEIYLFELLRTVTCKLRNGSCPVKPPGFNVIIVHKLPCLLGCYPVFLFVFPEGLFSRFPLSYIQHYPDNSGHFSRAVLVGGFMEKEISLYTVGTDYLSFVIVTSPALNKTPVILMIYLYKLLWNFLLKLPERTSYNFIFGKPHDLPGKTLITVYVCFI